MFIGIRLSFILVCKQEIGPFQSGTLPPPWGKTSIYGMPTIRCDQAGRSRGAWVQCGQMIQTIFSTKSGSILISAFFLVLELLESCLFSVAPDLVESEKRWKECPLEVESLQKGSCRPHVFLYSRAGWTEDFAAELCFVYRCEPQSRGAHRGVAAD